MHSSCGIGFSCASVNDEEIPRLVKALLVNSSYLRKSSALTQFSRTSGNSGSLNIALNPQGRQEAPVQMYLLSLYFCKSTHLYTLTDQSASRVQEGANQAAHLNEQLC